MRKSVLLWIFILIQLFPAIAQQPLENSLLWKISDNGLEQPSYLFGTIHVICPEDFKMDERILSALQSSKKIVLELNMSDPMLVQEMQQNSMNADFYNIQNEFDPEAQAALDAFLSDNYGMGLAQIGIMKPFILSTMVLMKQLPCETPDSYELFFTNKSQEWKIPMEGLETATYQISLFDKIPLERQIADLSNMILTDASAEEFKGMVDAYTAEDLGKLQEIITADGLTGEYGAILIDQRNLDWIPKIEQLIKQESTFIAVGAGHLPSEKGVIQLLRNAGYTVEPVR
ncbi:TraB/GumN family protein [Mongoliitalea daihaiensis]|uniref:TraB/GumN family protein n=1 Tax=Mongoliitalea daihaiensis TaxID=2782006 RepID=UPI001F15CB0C|nr:TraB/GumN family protein [Mongoliitalea daihaiensis]UJP63522.1 TraB/GumN family protein [Mongoliitalea daihaiensis]